MNLIQRLFGSATDATVLCPRCERAMAGHDDAECSRKMSRRFFFRTVGGAAAGVALAPPIAIVWAEDAIPNGGVITSATAIDFTPTVDLVALQLEKVRSKLTVMFESSDAIAALVQESNGISISRDHLRVPFSKQAYRSRL